MNKRRVLLIAGALIILGGFGYLIYGGIGSNLVFFLTPAELHAMVQEKGPQVHKIPMRLGGMVVAGSVKWDADNLDLRFTLADRSHTYAVHSKGAPPQMFKEGQGVIVEGTLSSTNVFESTNLMVKHSNEYRAPAGNGAKPRDMYKSLIREDK
ncbi:MAG: cytochrome c maturation protein CcmE [Gemmatimonadota bacterium]